MFEHTIQEPMIHQFQCYLEREEKSEATVKKYVREVGTFSAFLGSAPLTKEAVIAYKQRLIGCYAVRSVNTIIAALNAFFSFIRRRDCRIKPLKVQKQVYCAAERELTREEYMRLVSAAERNGKKQLSLVLQTICATGIRISELSAITVEAVTCGRAEISCKGKTRIIFIIRPLQKKLLAYLKRQQIRQGSIFITRNGKSLDRSNIWRQMKALCAQAKVDARKVFPHNLRHLFARIFYKMDHDLAKLADLLGHSSINTTRIYILTTGREHQRCMERMHLLL